MLQITISRSYTKLSLKFALKYALSNGGAYLIQVNIGKM
jgi:hypothetical protein